MIVLVNENNIQKAAEVHSLSWKESHRSFCTPEFVEEHNPEHQGIYLRSKIQQGSKVFMLVADEPVGIVSVTGNLIEDLYVLPSRQNHGYGSYLLRFAITQSDTTPALWILENNTRAERLYYRFGFRRTGRVNAITDRLNEIELALR